MDMFMNIVVEKLGFNHNLINISTISPIVVDFVVERLLTSITWMHIQVVI